MRLEISLLLNCCCFFGRTDTTYQLIITEKIDRRWLVHTSSTKWKQLSTRSLYKYTIIRGGRGGLAESMSVVYGGPQWSAECVIIYVILGYASTLAVWPRSIAMAIEEAIFGSATIWWRYNEEKSRRTMWTGLFNVYTIFKCCFLRTDWERND